MKIAFILCMMVVLVTLYNNSQEGLILLGMIVILMAIRASLYINSQDGCHNINKQIKFMILILSVIIANSQEDSSEDHYTHPIEAQDDGTNGLLIIPKQPKRH